MWKKLVSAIAAGVVAVATVHAGNESTPEVFGWVEKASIEPWGVQIKAKMDTGALTSSVHATNVERFERKGEEWVRFAIELEAENRDERVSRRYEKPVFRDVIVRNPGGRERRPVVLMKICLGENVYLEQFSLRNRGNMFYPMLIGRRTIQHLGLVDVTRTFTREPSCGEDAPVLRQGERKADNDIGI